MCIAKICNTLRGKHPETLRHSVLISGSNPLLIPYTPISYHPFGHPCLPPPIPHVSKRNFQPSSPATLETDVDSDKLAKYLAPWSLFKDTSGSTRKAFQRVLTKSDGKLRRTVCPIGGFKLGEPRDAARLE